MRGAFYVPYMDFCASLFIVATHDNRLRGAAIGSRVTSILFFERTSSAPYCGALPNIFNFAYVWNSRICR